MNDEHIVVMLLRSYRDLLEAFSDGFGATPERTATIAYLNAAIARRIPIVPEPWANYVADGRAGVHNFIAVSTNI